MYLDDYMAAYTNLINPATEKPFNLEQKVKWVRHLGKQPSAPINQNERMSLIAMGYAVPVDTNLEHCMRPTMKTYSMSCTVINKRFKHSGGEMGSMLLLDREEIYIFGLVNDFPAQLWYRLFLRLKK